MGSFSWAEIATRLGRAERDLLQLLDAFQEPWALIQVAVILLALLASIVLGRKLERALEPRVRAVQGQPRLLRFLALLLRRTRWIVAALLLGLATLVVRSITVPGNAAILELAAALILAWIAISVVSRLIRNRSLGRLIGWLAWSYVALWIVGALEDVSRALDQLAIRFGAVSISLYDVLQAIVVISVALWLASMLGRFVESRVQANPDLTPSLKVLLGKVFRIVLLVVAGSIALTALGIDLTALTVFSGALGVGLGFGLQKVVSNFVSGIIILLDKSIKPGDTISLGETFGWVRSLRSRFVSVMTRDGTEYLVPNEDFITQRVVSWSHSDTLHRLDVHFALAAGCDPHEVRRVATDATKAVERVEQRPQPVCHMTKFDGAAVEYILRFWICDPQNGVTNIRGNVLLACWDAFKAAGFELALETRDLLIRHPVSVQFRGEPGQASRGTPVEP